MSEESLVVMDSEEIDGVKFEIVHYQTLKGSKDLGSAEKVFFANQAGIHLKMVRATLKNRAIIIEPGALYFMKGQLELESKIEGGIAKGLFRKITSGETLFQSTIKGTGVVYLEPSFGHFIMVPMDSDDDELIMDDGCFYCASQNISVSGAIQKNISSAIFGGEGMIQTKVKGKGVVVLTSPVPQDELITYELSKGEKLFVDGNFALMRTKDVTFSVEKSGKSLFQSITSGEGLLQTFTGPGTVWIAPTQVVYERLKIERDINTAAVGRMSSNTPT